MVDEKNKTPSRLNDGRQNVLPDGQLNIPTLTPVHKPGLRSDRGDSDLADWPSDAFLETLDVCGDENNDIH